MRNRRSTKGILETLKTKCESSFVVDLPRVGTLYSVREEVQINHGHGLLTMTFVWARPKQHIDLSLDCITSDLERTQQLVRLIPAEPVELVVPELVGITIGAK